MLGQHFKRFSPAYPKPRRGTSIRLDLPALILGEEVMISENFPWMAALRLCSYKAVFPILKEASDNATLHAWTA